jgi:AraC-like DNA-binding protein
MDKLNPIRKTAGGITEVKFKAPGHERLAIEALSIDDLKAKAPATHFASLQRADFYRLIGVVGGHTRLMVDFSDHPAQAGDWVLIRPGQVMRYDFSQPWAGWMVVFRPDSLYGSPRQGGMDELRLQQHVDGLACQRRLDRAQHGWMDQSLRQMIADGALAANEALRGDLLRLQLGSTLLRLSLWQSQDATSPAVGELPSRQFKRFRDRLEADFASQHQVRHYANAIGIGERSLSRLCWAVLGMSAKACIAQRLILEAKRLLAHTSLSAQAIADQLGFDQPTNFAKHFRHHTGMTPLAFRQPFAEHAPRLSLLPPDCGPGPWPGTGPGRRA